MVMKSQKAPTIEIVMGESENQKAVYDIHMKPERLLKLLPEE